MHDSPHAPYTDRTVHPTRAPVTRNTRLHSLALPPPPTTSTTHHAPTPPPSPSPPPPPAGTPAAPCPGAGGCALRSALRAAPRPPTAPAPAPGWTGRRPAPPGCRTCCRTGTAGPGVVEREGALGARFSVKGGRGGVENGGASEGAPLLATARVWAMPRCNKRGECMNPRGRLSLP